MPDPSISPAQMAQAAAPISWSDWLTRWDAQQTAYLPYREERFQTMLDALELLSAEFVVLDLAC